MTIALIDDQLLGTVLRGDTPPALRSQELYTTGYWYVRLCQAVLVARGRAGNLSRPFAELPKDLRSRAINAVLELPPEIGLVSLRDLGPSVARFRDRYELNVLAAEALAAASSLNAHVHLSASSPLLQAALVDVGLQATVSTSTR